MKLTRELVEELAHIKAEKDKWVREEKRLVPKIKAKLEAKGLTEFAPDNCPYKLVLNTFQKSKVSWKDEWITLAKKYLGSKWKKILAKLIEESREDDSQLCVEPNENYKGGK